MKHPGGLNPPGCFNLEPLHAITRYARVDEGRKRRRLIADDKAAAVHFLGCGKQLSSSA